MVVEKKEGRSGSLEFSLEYLGYLPSIVGTVSFGLGEAEGKNLGISSLPLSFTTTCAAVLFDECTVRCPRLVDINTIKNWKFAEFTVRLSDVYLDV